MRPKHAAAKSLQPKEAGDHPPGGSLLVAAGMRGQLVAEARAAITASSPATWAGASGPVSRAGVMEITLVTLVTLLVDAIDLPPSLPPR